MRLWGALCIAVGCGAFGFHLAANDRKKGLLLQQLEKLLEWMECELQWQASSLPQLFQSAASHTSGPISRFSATVAQQLKLCIFADASDCVQTVLTQFPLFCEPVRELLVELGNSLGQLDLDGQLRQLGAVKARCQALWKKHYENQDQRVRSYQTLGLCAGFALAILLL